LGLSINTECPAGSRVEDYESHEAFEVEVQFVQQGTGKWARYTGATLKFRKPGRASRRFPLIINYTESERRALAGQTAIPGDLRAIPRRSSDHLMNYSGVSAARIPNQFANAAMGAQRRR